jgi:CBS-domain-containing membrane protein
MGPLGRPWVVLIGNIVAEVVSEFWSQDLALTVPWAHSCVVTRALAPGGQLVGRMAWYANC